MDDFDRKAMSRLPLAEAILRLFNFTCEEDFLNDVFQRHRGRAYESVIKFPLFVQLIADALMEYDGSGRKSFQRAEFDGDLTTTIRAAYGKLARTPLSLSVGLLTEGAKALDEIFPNSMKRRVTPESLNKMEVIVYDGKKIKHVAKRMKALRKSRGQIFGGKVLVAQSLSTGMAVAMSACEDGERGDPPLVPDCLAEVRSAIPGPRLHVGDRAFCDLVQMKMFTDEGDHFLVRWSRRTHFFRDESRPMKTGTDRRGRKYEEDWGRLGAESNSRRRYVRRIRLERPDQEEDVIIMTDILDEVEYPASDLLEVYLHRWDIERMFQKVTDVFHLRSLIGGTPQATVFQASFCFLLYDMIQVVRAYIAEGREMESEKISTENLFYDVHRQLIACHEIMSVETSVALTATNESAAQVVGRLRKLLHGQWSKSWLKSPSNTHKNPRKQTAYLTGGHNSAFRLIRKARDET